MKNKRSVCLKLLALVLIIAIFAAFTVLLVACNDEKPSAPQNPDSDSFVYKQAEHIGWAKSMSNAQSFSEYFENGEAAFVVPGLNKGENFVLQGIAYSSVMNCTLLCGYIKPETDKSNSVIFVMDMSMSATSTSGQTYNGVLVKELFLTNSDGSAFTGHAGGIAVTKKNVWVANNKKLYRIALDDIINAPKSGEIAFSDSVSVPVLASYCNYTDGVLWVGEFEYAKDDYVTDKAHHSALNSALTAWTIGYEINEDGEAGFDTTTGFKVPTTGDNVIPDYVLWHGEKVQGMTEAGNKIVLSTSYGRKNNSALYIYDNPVRSGADADMSVEIYGVPVPCYILSDGGKKVVAPPMTEDLSVMRDGTDYKILIASESGSYNYHGASAFNQSKYAVDFVWLYEVEQ